MQSNKIARLAALRDHHILEAPRSEEFDELVRRAGQLCESERVRLIAELKQLGNSSSQTEAERQQIEIEREADPEFTRTLLESLRDITERKQAERKLSDSQHRLALATESAKIGIWDWSVPDNIMRWDEQMLQLYGIATPIDTASYTTWKDAVHEDDRNEAETACARALLGEKDFDTQFRILWPNGEIRYIEAHALVQRDAGGTAVRMTGVNWDITDRKRAESALLDSEERFRTSMEAMEEGLALLDADGKIFFNNASAERILGLTSDQMTGLSSLDPAWRAVREDGTEFPGHEHPAMVALRDCVPQRNVVMGVHKPDGKLTWVSINAVPLTRLMSENGFERSTAQRVVVTFADITARVDLDRTLREREARLTAVLQAAPVVLYVVDGDGTITLSEGTGLAALGLQPGEVVGHSVFEFTGGNEGSAAFISRALSGEPLAYDTCINGLWLHVENSPLVATDGTCAGYIGVCFDITERVLTEERFRVLFDQSSDACVLYGEDGILDCNSGTLNLLGYPDKSALIGLRPYQLSPEFQPDGSASEDHVEKVIALAVANGGHRFEWMHLTAGGKPIPVEVTLKPISFAGRSVMLATWHDLTERKAAEQQLQYHTTALERQKNELEQMNKKLEELATTDGLTGLCNHRTFQQRLAEEVSRASRYGFDLSLIMLDVDTFKEYNDEFGHPAGDIVLKKIASILQEEARDGDTIARYGGEEFVLVLPQTASSGASILAERLKSAVENQNWPKCAVTASFGVSTLGLCEVDGVSLIMRADKALYKSKAAGRNQVTVAGHAEII